MTEIITDLHFFVTGSWSHKSILRSSASSYHVPVTHCLTASGNDREIKEFVFNNSVLFSEVMPYIICFCSPSVFYKKVNVSFQLVARLIFLQA